MQKITPFLWFNDQAEEAMNFYVSLFKSAKIGTVTRYPDDNAGPKGKVMTATFQLEGQDFIVLNGGPLFSFTEAISFVVNCESQEEVDHFWGKLTDGGQPSRCGWLKDKYGLSWQIVPAILPQLLNKDAATSQRVMQVVMSSDKLDIARLQQAYDGK
jgi:predicted 3-demethylubiquinone-9 3-methyltransferase (glyoxalase superfamily)